MRSSGTIWEAFLSCKKAYGASSTWDRKSHIAVIAVLHMKSMHCRAYSKDNVL